MTENDVKRLADGVLAKLDPDAVPPPAVARRRGVWFEHRRDGLVEMTGLLFAEQANFIDAEMDRIAHTVCKKDPRTEGERRTDALVAVFEGYDTLGCQCETESCELQVKVPKHAAVDPRTRADVSVVLNESTLAGLDDDPGLVDGHPMSAGVIRDLLARIDQVIFRPLGTIVEDLTNRVAEEVGEEVGGAGRREGAADANVATLARPAVEGWTAVAVAGVRASSGGVPAVGVAGPIPQDPLPAVCVSRV